MSEALIREMKAKEIPQVRKKSKQKCYHFLNQNFSYPKTELFFFLWRNFSIREFLSIFEIMVLLNEADCIYNLMKQHLQSTL